MVRIMTKIQFLLPAAAAAAVCVARVMSAATMIQVYGTLSWNFTRARYLLSNPQPKTFSHILIKMSIVLLQVHNVAVFVGPVHRPNSLIDQHYMLVAKTTTITKDMTTASATTLPPSPALTKTTTTMMLRRLTASDNPFDGFHFH